MSRLAATILLAASLAACVGQRPLDNDQHCPCAPGWWCDVPRNVCVPNGIDGGYQPEAAPVPTMFSASEVQAALARCDLPHGPPVEVITPNDEATKLVGAWLLCPPPAAQPQTIFTPAIRLEANWNFDTMAMNSEGGLVAGVGLVSQGEWGVSCYYVPLGTPNPNAKPCVGVSGEGVLVRAHTLANDNSPAGCFDGPIRFESEPVRAHVVDSTGGCAFGDPFDFWLVPLP